MTYFPSARVRFWLALSLTVLVGNSAFAQGRRQAGDQERTRPPPMAAAVVPAHALSIILARPTETSITLSILTENSGDYVLQVGSEKAREVSVEGGKPKVIQLSALSPNREYRYVLTAPDGTETQGAFRTARAIGAPFSFAIQADSHLDSQSDPAVYLRTLNNIAAAQSDFLIDLGDTFMVDKFENYQDAEAQYLAQRYYLGVAGKTMPVFLVSGNHDGEIGWRSRLGEGMAEWSRSQRLKYFPGPDQTPFYSIGPAGSNAYAWKWGAALFVVLDPFTQTTTRAGRDSDGWAWTLGKPQYDWLSNVLSTTSADYKFVFIHHLVGGRPTGQASEARGGAEASSFFEWGGQNTDGSDGFAANRPGWAMPIHEVLRKTHVTVVFHGHDHLYVHQVRDGITYQEVPQPSHKRGDATNSAAEYGYQSGKLLGSSGYVRVTIGGKNARVDYVKSQLSGSSDEVADSYTIQPHPSRIIMNKPDK